MTRGVRLGLPLMVGLAIGLGACAVAPLTPTSKELAAGHRAKAEALERQGNLRRALDEWKIALTINRDDPIARQRQKKVEGRIERLLADRLRRGREALSHGAHQEARRHFLAALALDPFNKVAFEALQNEVKETRIVVHTVRRGETLDAIAERYYGDRARGGVIAETNKLPPNPRLVAGTTLKIPEIAGVPLADPDARPSVPHEEELSPVLDEAREALEKGDHMAALAEVERLLAGNPQHPAGLDLKKAILYGLGKSQLDQRKYLDSYQTLTQLAKLDPNYQDAAVLIDRTRERLVQDHYSQGLRLFQEERLEEAIAQWRIVLDLDPQHAGARRNIEQAERLLRALEERKKK